MESAGEEQLIGDLEAAAGESDATPSLASYVDNLQVGRIHETFDPSSKRNCLMVEL